RGWIGFTAASSAAVTIVAPWGATIRLIRPEATELLTNRTHPAAGRSPVNRPRPATSVGSSRRRIERPTQPPSFLASPAIPSCAAPRGPFGPVLRQNYWRGGAGAPTALARTTTPPPPTNHSCRAAPGVIDPRA